MSKSGAPNSEGQAAAAEPTDSNSGNRSNPWTRPGPTFKASSQAHNRLGSAQEGEVKGPSLGDAFDFKRRPRGGGGFNYSRGSGRGGYFNNNNNNNNFHSNNTNINSSHNNRTQGRHVQRWTRSDDIAFNSNTTQDLDGDVPTAQTKAPRGGGMGDSNNNNNNNDFWGGPKKTGRYNRNSFRDSAHHDENGDGLVPIDNEEAEVLELFAKTRMNTGINFSKYSAIPVKCVPENVTPMETFDSMNLENSLMENITRAGYLRPTPIQKYALPIVTRNRDLMACAQTGSGKTAAFLIPVVQDILTNGKGRLPPHLRADYRNEAVPSGLVLAPTRELTVQIYDEARKFCFRTGLRTVVIYGGVDSYNQKNELLRGCDIIVATPGRLWDLYQQKVMYLACIRTVVLDEADRMLDLGFEEQIRHIMQNSDLPSTGERQTLMFSATFPAMIQTLAKNYLHSYFFVTVGRVGSTTEGITQRVGYAEPHEKLAMVESLLQKDPNVLTLIFVERKSSAEELKVSLSQSGFRVDTIHGDRQQHDREHALSSFRNGEVTVLVATDVASRGLDIPNVGHVIQYDMPSSMDDYIHRIGRTGRAGNIGIATAIFTDENSRMATELVEILREHNQSVPEWLSDVMLRTIQDKSKQSTFRGGRRGGY